MSLPKKGNVVEEAFGFFDAFIKKYELGPVVELFKSIIQQLIDMVDSYPLFIAFKEFIDLLISKIQLFQKFGIA
jgi:hypothetical protein